MIRIKALIATLKQHIINTRFVLSGIVLAFSVVVGLSGVATANPNQSNNGDKQYITFCKQDFKLMGWDNVGQCVSNHNHHKHQNQGHGYGGDGDNDADDIGSNSHQENHHDFFGVIYRYFFGH